MTINTKAITKAVTVHLKKHKDSLENRAFHQIHVRENGTAEYVTKNMLIQFEKGIFAETVVLDTRTKGQIEKGFNLPPLEFLKTNFPRTEQLYMRDPENDESIAKKEFNVIDLLNTIKELDKSPTKKRYKSISFYYDSKEFVADINLNQEQDHFEFEADHLVRVLQVMKALGDKTVKLYYYDNPIRPFRPFEVHSDKAKAIIAPIAFWYKKE